MRVLQGWAAIAGASSLVSVASASSTRSKIWWIYPRGFPTRPRSMFPRAGQRRWNRPPVSRAGTNRARRGWHGSARVSQVGPCGPPPAGLQGSQSSPHLISPSPASYPRMYSVVDREGCLPASASILPCSYSVGFRISGSLLVLRWYCVGTSV